LVTKFPPLVNFGTDTPKQSIPRVSPVTTEKIFDVPLSSENETNKLIDLATQSLEEIENLGRFERAKLLGAAASYLENFIDDIAYLVHLETGKSLQQSIGETRVGIDFMKNLSGYAIFQDGISIPSKIKGKSVITKSVPYGVAVLIVSFNTPIPNYSWKFAPSFLSGNVSILKPSPYTSGSAQFFVEKMIDGGIPKNALHLLHGDEKAGEALVKSNIQLLSFTGSARTGKKIMEDSGGLIRKNILELGGSNPFIVCKSAKLELAADFLIESGFSNAGQRCAAGSRAIIHENIFDEFFKIFEEKIAEKSLGTLDTDFFGPVISEQAANSINNYIRAMSDLGNDVKQYGKIRDSNDQIVQATSIICRSQNELNGIEIFGPVVRFQRFQNRDEAINLANNNEYGLTSAVWTEDFSEYTSYSEKLKFGVVNFNGPTHGSEFQFPFGGTGNSGNGTKEVGLGSLTEYSDTKLISITNHD
jgi:acyl-CoA reductase-like NAD-dependent aldehyde dehydrogenase